MRRSGRVAGGPRALPDQTCERIQLVQWLDAALRFIADRGKQNRTRHAPVSKLFGKCLARVKAKFFEFSGNAAADRVGKSRQLTISYRGLIESEITTQGPRLNCIRRLAQQKIVVSDKTPTVLQQCDSQCRLATAGVADNQDRLGTIFGQNTAGVKLEQAGTAKSSLHRIKDHIVKGQLMACRGGFGKPDVGPLCLGWADYEG